MSQSMYTIHVIGYIHYNIWIGEHVHPIQIIRLYPIHVYLQSCNIYIIMVI